MRMIEQEIITAIRNQQDFTTGIVQDMYRKKEGRRDVLQWNDYGMCTLKLWGHPVAVCDTISKILSVCDWGYATATTKSRLNAVFAALDIPMSCSVRNKKMVYFYKGKEISEKEVETSDYVISIS